MRNLRHLAAVGMSVAVIGMAGAAASPLYTAAPAQASVVHASAVVVPKRLIAIRWARTQAGKPYIFGGTGPGGYDCSGLVMMAYRHAGISLPRTSEEMEADGRQLVAIPRSQARWGDIVAYGPGHVELYFGNIDVPVTFGAHASGQVIGPIRWGWGFVPTAFYRVR